MTLDAYLLWRFPPARQLKTESELKKFLWVLKRSSAIMNKVPKEIADVS